MYTGPVVIDSLDIEGGVLLFKEPDSRRALLLTVLACILFALTVFIVTNGFALMFVLLLPTGMLFMRANAARKETSLEYRPICFQIAAQHMRIHIDRAILHEGDYDDQCFICLQEDITSAMLTMGNVFRLDANTMHSFIMRGDEILKHDVYEPYTVTIAITGDTWKELEAFLNGHGIATS